MTKSDKIREYFRKYPSADVAKVATKFQAPKPMTYKLRKQVQEEWKPPAALPVPPISSWAKIMEEVEAEETNIDETMLSETV